MVGSVTVVYTIWRRERGRAQEPLVGTLGACLSASIALIAEYRPTAVSLGQVTLTRIGKNKLDAHPKTHRR